MQDQFEVFERTISAGQTTTIEASRQPERWLIYSSNNMFSGTLAVMPGTSVPTTGAERLLAYTWLTVPGITPFLTVRNDTGIAIPIVASAVTNLPLTVDRLAQGGETGNPDKGTRMYGLSDYTVGTGSESFWPLDQVEFDTDTMAGPYPTYRINIKTAGKYLIYSHVVWLTVWGYHYLYIWRNQTEILDFDSKYYVAGSNPQYSSLRCSTVCNMAVGDYLQAVVYQNSGNPRVLKRYPRYSAYLGAQRLTG